MEKKLWLIHSSFLWPRAAAHRGKHQAPASSTWHDHPSHVDTKKNVADKGRGHVGVPLIFWDEFIVKLRLCLVAAVKFLKAQ
jgi:hypothetical protein